MKAIDLFAKTRLYLEDMTKTRYSDWEIFSAINDALRLVAEENAKVNGPLFRKRVLLITDDESFAVELPEDFVKEIKAFDADDAELFNVHNDEPFAGEFTIRGDRLVAPDKTVVLWYFSYPEKIKNPSDKIDLPSSMVVPVAKIASQCAKSAHNAALESAQYFYGDKNTTSSA